MEDPLGCGDAGYKAHSLEVFSKAHAACMPDDKLPLQVLFERLPGPGVKGHPRDL